MKLYIIAGNHDDIKRLAQRSDYLEKADIFITSEHDLKGRVISIDQAEPSIDLCLFIPSPQRASEVFDQPCDDYEQTLKLQLSCSQFFGKDSLKFQFATCLPEVEW